MQKARAFFLWMLLLLACGFSLSAQEDEEPGSEEEPPLESDWSVYMPTLYSRGDQTFTISIGVIFPTVFFQNSKTITHNINVVGGTGRLSYNYFFSPHFFVGGEIGGMFDYTLRENTLFIIPIGVRAGYQFILKRFEFPLALTLGIAPQRFLDYSYLGFFVKPSAAAYFRFNPDWSFGITTDWWWIPQRPEEKDKSVDGNFIDVTLSARYHF
jgi:hypothetical protein